MAVSEKHLHRRYLALKRKAGEQKTQLLLSADEVCWMYKSGCYYCGTHSTGKATAKKISIIRKDQSKPYNATNSIPCCQCCLNIKGDKSHAVFKAYLGNITAKTLAKNGIRVFFLQRHHDVHGVSGTGKVAVAVEFPSKKCVMEWLSKYTTETIYENIQQIEEIHGHEGRTILAFKFDAG